MEFNELKQGVLRRAKNANACSGEYKRAYKAETKKDLLQVIVDNLVWCFKREMLNTQYLIDNFSELFIDFGIYTSGHHELKNCGAILLGSSSATIETWDSSSATIETWDSSSATYELIGDYSTIKDLNRLKLFIKKSKFEIVEVE